MNKPVTDEFDAVLIRVHSRDNKGRPEAVSIIWDDQLVHLQEGDSFFTAFINKSASGV